MLSTRSFLPIAAIATTLALAAPAWAQRGPSAGPGATGPSTSGPQAPNAGAQISVNDQDIAKFANAANDVVHVKQKWLPTIISKREPAEQQKAQQQAMDEMTKAVEKNGLSVDRYNQIADAAQSDPVLQRKIEQRLPQGGGADDQSEDSKDPPADEM